MISPDEARVDASIVSAKTGQHVSIRLVARGNDGQSLGQCPAQVREPSVREPAGQGAQERADRQVLPQPLRVEVGRLRNRR